ncbi:MAG: uroporphyrinogen-III C-methyltransferase [Chloroflexi bacterium]|nr:uroporphyrinogen-III C-methyltransferase [Chloroflexota bacterium]
MSVYFPVALDLRGQRCVVVGGGPVAERKVLSLLDGGADDVLVVAPTMTSGIELAASQTGVRLLHREFQPEDLSGARLVMVATDEPAVTELVAAEARARHVLVNVADDPDRCDFIMPAVVRRGDLQIAIGTGGNSPAFARFIRETLEALLPAEYALLLDITSSLRAEARTRGVAIDPETWQAALRGDALARLCSSDTRGAEASLRHGLGLSTAAEGGPADDSSGRERKGRIILVGAGPGDPGLLTIAGKRALETADVVLYDRLANEALLKWARPEARLVYVGKGPREEGPMSQDEINAFICAEARAGLAVVRLKGGDPFVFGRGGEEALAAVGAGVLFTVIPGVTAAVGVPAYAGIPVTHRGLSTSFTVITGQQGPSGPPVDWQAVSDLGGTLVLLMGVETLPDITRELLKAGLSADTPAAIIEHGMSADQRVVQGTLADIAQQALALVIQAPATTVIGAVAGLATELAWFEAEGGGGSPAPKTGSSSGT